MWVCQLVCGACRVSLEALEYASSHVDVFPIRNICLFLSLSTASSPGLYRYSVGEMSSGWFWMLLLLKLGHVPSVENELLRINIYTLILAWMMVLAFYSQQKEREHYPNPKSKIFYPFAVNLFWGKKADLTCIFWKLLCWDHNNSQSRDQHYVLYFMFLASWQTC